MAIIEVNIKMIAVARIHEPATGSVGWCNCEEGKKIQTLLSANK